MQLSHNHTHFSKTLMEISAGDNEGGLGDFKFSNTGKGAAKGGGGSGEKNGTHVVSLDHLISLK